MMSSICHRNTGTLLLLALVVFGLIYYFVLTTALPRFDSSDFTSYFNRTSSYGPAGDVSIIYPEHVAIATPTNSISHKRLKSTRGPKYTQSTACSISTSTVYFPVLPEGTGTPYLGSGQKVLEKQKQISKEEQTAKKLHDAGIAILFKTGAQETAQLAVHASTTLRYLNEKNLLIFSDVATTLGPLQIHDALKNVNQTYVQNHSDFEIYRKIQEFQRDRRKFEGLKEERSKGDGRQGWRLDKWKLIHVVSETWEKRPREKWYVFVETDSYIFYQNLITWLGQLDPKEPRYIGAVVLIGEHAFAHGGSGYILSHAAMQELLGPPGTGRGRELAASWDDRMDTVCCGDLALGLALKEAGVGVEGAHPLINGEKAWNFEYGPRYHWCRPAVTMHHLGGGEICGVWGFEREWEVMGADVNGTTFEGMYHHFVEPQLREERENWDNLSFGREYSEETVAKMIKEEEENEVKLAKEKEVTDEEARKKQEIIDKYSKEQEEAGDRRPDSELRDVQEAAKEYEGSGGDEKKDIEEVAVKNEEGENAEPKKKESPKNDDTSSPSISPEPLDSTPQKRSLLPLSQRDQPPQLTKTPISQNTNITISHHSFTNCRRLCESREDCFQFTYINFRNESENICKTAHYFRLGDYMRPEEEKKDSEKKGDGKDEGGERKGRKEVDREDGKKEGEKRVKWRTGWMVERIRKWMGENKCPGPEWP